MPDNFHFAAFDRIANALEGDGGIPLKRCRTQSAVYSGLRLQV